MTLTVPGDNIYSFHGKQSFTVKNYFKDILKKDLQVEFFDLFIQCFKIQPLIGDYQLTFNSAVIHLLAGVTGLQDYLVRIQFYRHLTFELNYYYIIPAVCVSNHIKDAGCIIMLHN